LFFIVVGVFIGQSLLMAAQADDRIIASYPTYFDAAWKLAVQISFALSFCGTFWLVLCAGAGLLMLIEINVFKELFSQGWFSVPVTILANAYALHLTDVRVGLVRGMRTLKLNLLSWLLPVMVLFTGIFIVGLPYKGLAILWRTHHASQILLGVAAWLIVLINAAYQDGTPEHTPSQLLRKAGTAGAGMLPILVAISLYAFFLRIDQYGWTVNMIELLACLIIMTCYAGGYVWAMVTPGAWLKRLEKTNIYTSFIILIVLLLLFTPIADPARLSVADQVARLKDGQISAEKFDYNYLRYKTGSYGTEALEKLKADGLVKDTEMSKKMVDQSAMRSYPYYYAMPFTPPTPPSQEELAGQISVYPLGQSLPDSFLKMDWSQWELVKCDAFIIDQGQGVAPQILLTNTGNFMNAALFKADGDRWIFDGRLSPLANCRGIHDIIKGATLKLVPSEGRDLEINGIRIPIYPDETCE
jgi:hypothetical protein